MRCTHFLGDRRQKDLPDNEDAALLPPADLICRFQKIFLAEALPRTERNSP